MTRAAKGAHGRKPVSVEVGSAEPKRTHARAVVNVGPAQPKPTRSPGYPGLSLRSAVSYLKKLHDAQGQDKALIPEVFGHWSYSLQNSYAAVALSALRKYGLVDVEGSGSTRAVSVSNDGLAILSAEPNSKEWLDALKSAALKPKLNRRIWDELCGDGFPNHDVLRDTLIGKFEFTEAGATHFLIVFRETLTFAGLINMTSLSDWKVEERDQRQRPASAEVGGAATSTSEFTLTLAKGTSTEVKARFAPTRQGWSEMLSLLKGLKPQFLDKPGTKAVRPKH